MKIDTFKKKLKPNAVGPHNVFTIIFRKKKTDTFQNIKKKIDIRKINNIIEIIIEAKEYYN